MLHCEMCNISNFVQISSVLAQRSTAPTYWAYTAVKCQVVLDWPVVGHPSKMMWMSSQMGISAGWRASAHGP